MPSSGCGSLVLSGLLPGLPCSAKPSTVNRETAYSKLGFKLLWLSVPQVSQLVENNVRQGFLRIPDFHALLAEIKDPDVRDLIEFLYNSGCRQWKPMAMQWSLARSRQLDGAAAGGVLEE